MTVAKLVEGSLPTYDTIGIAAAVLVIAYIGFGVYQVDQQEHQADDAEYDQQCPEQSLDDESQHGLIIRTNTEA